MESTASAVPKWVRRSIFLWWGVLVGLWLIYVTARELRGLLVQIVLALSFSFALDPAVERLGRRGVRRSTATGLSLLVALVVTIAFLGAMGTLLANQLNDLVRNLPDYFDQTQIWLDDQFGITFNADDLRSQFEPGGEASRFATGIAGNLVGIGTTVIGLLFQTLTVTLFAYYLTADGPRLRRVVCSVLPPERQHAVLAVWNLAIAKTGAYISSRFLLALISSVFHWVFFQILDLPSPVALAIWVGVISQFIPTLGTYLAGLLPMVVALGVQPSRALWVVGAVVVYQQIENYVLQPRITGQSLNMHPGVAIGAVLVGTELFGPTGALVALPVVATATAFLTAYVERHDVVDDPLVGPVEL
ncbi:MAG: AI-2E family transporter [Actinomycetota bacterium]|nr:AI-2E family transporter [Actinomycetota bacterium]